MTKIIVALKAEIETAFANVSYPGDDNLTTSYNPLSSNDDEGVADYFRKTSWHGHSVQNLRYHSCALSFFTPAAFHYYLPAFLIADLEDPEEADIITNSVQFDFTASSSSRTDRMKLFSAPQLAVIELYIDHVIARDGHYAIAAEAKDFLAKQLAEMSTKS